MILLARPRSRVVHSPVRSTSDDVIWGNVFTGAEHVTYIDDNLTSAHDAVQRTHDALFHPEAPELPITLTVVDNPHTREWDEAERFVYRVFREAGFCEISQREWVEEIDRYRPSSALHVAHTEDGSVVGCVRTMLGTYHELPIGQFRPSAPVPAGTLCEIGSLAVDISIRGLGVVNELHRAALQWALRHGAVGFCMLVEPWSVDFFRDVYGVPLIESAPARHYMGSLTVPATATFESLWATLIDHKPGMLAWSTEGLTPTERVNLGVPILLP